MSYYTWGGTGVLAVTTGAGSLSPSRLGMITAFKKNQQQGKKLALGSFSGHIMQPPLQAGGAKGCTHPGKDELTHSACVADSHTPPWA